MKLNRILAWFTALVIGAAYGTASTISHGFRIGGWPVGLVIVVLGAGAMLLAVRLLVEDRWATVACGAGLLLATALFSQEGPGGSVIVPSGRSDAIGPVNLGIAWFVCAAVLVLVAVLWPDTKRHRPDGSN
ncbi:MAG TPA: histidinol dehydrogenase [Microbacterium sp.]|uniref:histidinol dehydrogenase n=1 Tax=Microbacterium sp. TaxID=51671 RepID=UPI002B45F483|nr:histidinol dehydrogenase [Microbacterium sp.]HKT55759.1 histidinol dehydrogenase [Microbacterium sp.]